MLCAVVAAAPRRSGARLDPARTGRGQWGALAPIGVIGGSVPFVLFFEGLARASSPQAAFLHKTLVLWVALLAVVVLGERLQWGTGSRSGCCSSGRSGSSGARPTRRRAGG